MIQNENRAQQIKLRFIREYNIKVLDEWLSGCVSFCLQENPKTSNESLFQFAFSQWLLADLNDVGVAVLPSELSAQKDVHTLNGSFPVQMQYLIDISEPAYDQWRNLYDKKIDEADDEVQMRRSQAAHTKKRRVLKLELTDGKTTIMAMEHNAVSCLNTKLAPGLKLLLTGPMRCINMVLFLESKNVRVLGGEVDILLITNAYENVLLRAMNKSANPNPKIDYEEVEVVENKNKVNYNTIRAVPMEHDQTHSDQRRNQCERKLSALEVDDADDDSLLMGIDLDVVESSQKEPDITVSRPEQVASISTLMDDDEMDDIVQLVEVPDDPAIMHHQVSSTKPSQPSPKCVVSTCVGTSFDEPFEDDINIMNSLEEEIQNELRGFQPDPSSDIALGDFDPPAVKKSRVIEEHRVTPLQSAEKTSPSSPSTPPSRAYQANDPHNPTRSQPSTSKMFNRFNASSLFEESIECGELNEADPSTKSFNILSPHYAFRVAGTNLATIEQILALSEQDRAGASFVVYGEVSSVTEQPRIRKERWHLGIALTDQSEPLLSVRLHNDVIAKMVRHEAGDVMRMHKTDREGVMKMLDSILAEFKELLQEIKCFWLVIYPPDGVIELPVVMEAYDMNDERGAILLDKIIKENCNQLRKML